MDPSFVRLTVQGGWSGAAAPGFRLLLDGHAVDVGGAGVHDVLVQPGHHVLEFSVWWLRRHGHASIEVDVAPAQFVEVFYAPPYHVFARGVAGPHKQNPRGLLGLVVLLGGILLVSCFLAVFIVR